MSWVILWFKIFNVMIIIGWVGLNRHGQWVREEQVILPRGVWHITKVLYVGNQILWHFTLGLYTLTTGSRRSNSPVVLWTLNSIVSITNYVFRDRSEYWKVSRYYFLFVVCRSLCLGTPVNNLIKHCWF